MDKYRAIPQGYMTVGEIAKKMGVTVRTGKRTRSNFGQGVVGFYNGVYRG